MLLPLGLLFGEFHAGPIILCEIHILLSLSNKRDKVIKNVIKRASIK